jgi:oligo-alginate lyase
MLFCDAYGRDFGKRESVIVKQMLVNAYNYAFDNHAFPVPNDGWPDLNLKTFVHAYHIAAKVFGEDSQLGNLVKNIENDGTQRTSLPLSETYYWDNRIPLERLLFTPEFNLASYSPTFSRSYNFPQSKFAMLRAGKVNVFIKYGLNGPSHAHPDIMNIEVAYGAHMVSRDLSNAGYRSRLCNEWHRKTLSHTTVCCDGLNIPSCERGTCLAYDGVSISVSNTSVYPGIDYVRSIVVNPKGFTDDFQVITRQEGVRDYLFHLESGFTITNKYAAIAVDLSERANGYQHLFTVQEIVREQGLDSVVLEASDGNVRVVLTVALAAGQRLFLCKSMDNPVNRMRSTMIIREIGKSVRFDVRAEFYNQ